MIIAIDGPAGSGKSTVAKIIARRLGYLYIDTGAMYRALTLKAIKQNIPVEDEARLIAMAKESTIELINKDDGSLQVLLDGEDVSLAIREPRVTKLVSEISKIKDIRKIMVELQRQLGNKRDCILDGRDIGTVVFPKANRKFYLDADFKERVKRRYKELKEAGQDITFEEVENDLRNRDTIDSTREVAPLKKADDAIYVDTTNMSIDEVVETLLKEIRLSG